ncbi:MAG: Dabb family protein [Balneolaceae bacterium]
MKVLLFLMITLISTSVLMTTQPVPQNEAVRHIVVFKYKTDATDSQIKKVTDSFRELKDKIPGITHFEHGVNNSPEGRNMGFTHIYQMTFEDEESRDDYLPHPEHKKFGEMLGRLDILEDVFVVDYIPEE